LEAADDHLFGAYDIRGVVGPELDSPNTRAIAAAYGDFLSPERPGRFGVGHDARVSSPALAEAVSIGLRERGHQVVHMGLATTPMVYWYGAQARFDGSVTVTASHLGPEYNGLKLCERDGLPLSQDRGLPEIAARSHQSGAPSKLEIQHVLERRSPLAWYVATLRSRLGPAKALKIAVDAGNGVGGLDTDRVFSALDPVEVWRLGFHPDGLFPRRAPNPLEKNALDALAGTVTKHGLDFGVAFDGDADRAIVVDERGRMVPPDAIGGLIALHLLDQHPGATILYDLRSTRALAEEVERAGGSAVRTRVGHAFIKPAMRERQAVFAAELSGHYYYQDLHYTDNGLRTLIELVNLVSAGDRPLSQRVSPFRTYYTSGELNRDVHDRDRAVEEIEKAYDGGHIDHLDGLSVDYPDCWFNVRPSQTEPLLLRLNVGAKSQDRLEQETRSLLSKIAPFVARGSDREKADPTKSVGARTTKGVPNG